MKNLFKYIISIMMGAGLVTTSAYAAEDCSKRRTKEEAVAMVKDAVKFYNENGREKAFAQFSDQTSKWRDCDLFLITLSMDGTTLAHAALPKMIGKNIMQLTDKNGVKIIVSFFDAVKTKNEGWSAKYDFINPISKQLEPKLTFVQKVTDAKNGDFVLAAGFHTAP